MSPTALRALYTGAIRPIFLWGAEVWRDTNPNISTFQRLEYQALRKITGAYHGSSHQALGLIANVEPIDLILRDRATKWAAKAIRTGDPQIRQLLQEGPSECFPYWHDGSLRLGRTQDPPLAAAFHNTALASPNGISWGNHTSHPTDALLHITLMTPDDPKSREKGYYAAMLAQLQPER